MGKGHTNKIGAKETVYSYLSEPVETRLELKKFLKVHKMTRRVFYPFESDFRKDNGSEQKAIRKQELKETVLDAWDRLDGKDPVERKSKEASQGWLKGKGHEINEALIQSCKGGNAQSLKLFFQLTEQLVEKQEVKIGLNADEIARRNLEADRQLREGGY